MGDSKSLLVSALRVEGNVGVFIGVWVTGHLTNQRAICGERNRRCYILTHEIHELSFLPRKNDEIPILSNLTHGSSRLVLISNLFCISRLNAVRCRLWEQVKTRNLTST